MEMETEKEKALLSENGTFKEVIHSLRCEKEAIDQVALAQIQENIKLRTHLIMVSSKLSAKETEIKSLNDKIEELNQHTEDAS